MITHDHEEHGHDHADGAHARRHAGAPAPGSAHGHANAHPHGHAHAPVDFGRAFAIGTALNVGFVVIEVVAGLYANSMALLADAGHNLSDVLGLLMAWGASVLVSKQPTANYTYGFGSSSILAALGNAVLLLVAVGAIAWEAAYRLVDPPGVASGTMIAVAAAGILVNGFTASLFASGHSDVNIRGAYLHMAADAAISLGVVIAGLAILFTGWAIIDPVVSLVIAVVIVWGTWGLLTESTRLALHGVPAGIAPERVRERLAALPGVAALHDLHIWPMSTTETALTCHLLMPSGHPGDAFLVGVSKTLREEFGIGHATLQIEIDRQTECTLECTCAAAGRHV